MKCYVGTSGWAYSWNPQKSLDYYIEKTGLNAVELNSSFYHFPLLTSVQTWSKKGANLHWSIKVNRLFTHTYKFNENTINRWSNFFNLFRPLDSVVDFYLFQMPPSLTPKAAPNIEALIKKTQLSNRCALEFRNPEWFTNKWINWAIDLGITLVSVDAPNLPRWIFNTSDRVYIRMHGRTSWYAHQYTPDELYEVEAKIKKANPEKVYIFFNNDHAMPKNARTMLQILKKQEAKTVSLIH